MCRSLKVSDNFTWIVGRHSIQMGGYFKWITSHEQTTLDYNSYDIGLGGEVQGLNASLRPTKLLTPSGTAQVTNDSNFTYSLPFGRGRQFASNVPWWLDELVGGWDLSGIPIWHGGQTYSTVASAFVAGYANDAPGIFNGDKAALKHDVHKGAGGALYLYADPAAVAGAFTDPAGFHIGSRNNLRSPQYFNVDAGLAKNFMLYAPKNLTLQFRADAFNVLNHPNFDQLDYADYSNYIDITQPSSFGQLTALNGAPRVVQLSGRIQF
jgi:hypothetical protein